MRTFAVKNNRELFNLKTRVIDELKTMESSVNAIFASVQNEGTIITDEDLSNIDHQLDIFDNSYNEVDDILFSFVKSIIEQEVF